MAVLDHGPLNNRAMRERGNPVRIVIARWRGGCGLELCERTLCAVRERG